jgi:hypothetical protein
MSVHLFPRELFYETAEKNLDRDKNVFYDDRELVLYSSHKVAAC